MAAITKTMTETGADRWRVRWSVWAAGKRIQRSRNFDSAKAARAFRRKVDTDEAMNAGTPGRLTVGTYIIDWLDRLGGRGGLLPSTFNGYRRHLGNACIYIDHIILEKLTRRDVEACYTRLLRDGGKSGRPASPQSVRHVHGALKRVFKDAVADGLLAVNPAEFSRPPALDRPPAKAPKSAEIKTLFDVARSTRYFAFAVLLYVSGLRRGEALALRRSDIDLDSLTVDVWQAVWEDGDAGTWGIKDTPKRRSSVRSVALPEMIRPILKAHYAKVDEDRLWWGRDWVDLGLAFPTPNGDVQRPRDLTKALARLTKRAGWREGLQPVHALRHAHATELLGAQLPAKVVSDRLGHSTIAITSDLYQRTPDALDRAAAAVFENKKAK